MSDIITEVGIERVKQIDLKKLEDNELARLMMEADEARTRSEEADDLYWLCIKEVNRRIANGEMENPD